MEYEYKIGPNDEDIYIQDTNWIKDCDVVIAEVTNLSLGLGYELSYAKNLNKKVICLFRNGGKGFHPG